jgi:hypothetical protein
VPTDWGNEEIWIDLIPWPWTRDRNYHKDWINVIAYLSTSCWNILRIKCSKEYNLPPYQISLACVLQTVHYHNKQKLKQTFVLPNLATSYSANIAPSRKFLIPPTIYHNIAFKCLQVGIGHTSHVYRSHLYRSHLTRLPVFHFVITKSRKLKLKASGCLLTTL